MAVTDYVDFVDNSVAAKASGLRMPFDYDLRGGGTSLFGQGRIGAVHTYTTVSDLIFRITVQRK